ncbi:hypothetical protein CCB80_06745 [Armatimonadetes bacterium Uphvl-Ar1]|nr:hypothetical protein CCB80_06745 [Armatimonadetes bacterium Uphvl-Ar1]
MSVSGTGVRFSGLASGIDVDSIISQMIRLEQFPVQRLQAQQAQLSARQTIYGQFKSTLNGLNSAASSLNIASSFQPNKVSSGDTTIATATVTDAAVPGNYGIDVLAIARADKMTSSAFASTSDALGLAGLFMVNGKSLDVAAGDSLTAIASKINGLNVGVSANVINGGTGQSYLVLGGGKTGARNAILLADVSGGVAQSLGLTTGSSTLRDLTGSVAKSAGFKNSTDTLGTLTGATSSGTLTLGSDAIAYNLSTDTLQSLADKINLTGNHTASLVTEKVDGVDVTRIQINSTSWPATYTDPGNLLGVLGVTKAGTANPVTTASDAQVEIDGVTINSASNTLTNVVGGMTLDLKKVGTTEIAVTRDNTAIKDKVKAFQKAYNDVIGYIRDNSQFNNETFQSGPLFGDSNAAQVESSLNTLLFSNVGTGSIKNLADIGFSLDDKGKIELDESKLDAAITNNLSDLKNLMMATGSSANSEISYVSSGNKSLGSGPSGFGVNITQAATKASVTALNAFNAPHAGGETLAFSGTLFGSSTINLTISAGTNLASLVSQINSDSRLKDLVTASDMGGSLRLESKRFGTSGNFAVTSNLAEGADNSGLGTTGGTAVAGLNVAGTINGEAATGNGQFLLGNTGNANTDGLQIRYTGTATGSIGSFVFNRGMSGLMSNRVSSFTDSVNGLLTTVDNSITDQVEDLQERINRLNSQIELREQTLRLRFAAMEEAISRANSQGAQLSSILNAR